MPTFITSLLERLVITAVVSLMYAWLYTAWGEGGLPLQVVPLIVGSAAVLGIFGNGLDMWLSTFLARTTMFAQVSLSALGVLWANKLMLTVGPWLDAGTNMQQFQVVGAVAVAFLSARLLLMCGVRDVLRDESGVVGK